MKKPVTLKRMIPILVAGVIAVAAGVGFDGMPRTVRVCLILLGVILTLGSLAYWALIQTEKRCLACGQRIYLNAAQMGRVRSGLTPCPRCGALVRVDHVSPC